MLSWLAAHGADLLTSAVMVGSQRQSPPQLRSQRRRATGPPISGRSDDPGEVVMVLLIGEMFVESRG